MPSGGGGRLVPGHVNPKRPDPLKHKDAATSGVERLPGALACLAIPAPPQLPEGVIRRPKQD